MPMLLDLGRVGDQVRDREQKEGFIWGDKPLFSDAPAHSAPPLKALSVVQNLPESL